MLVSKPIFDKWKAFPILFLLVFILVLPLFEVPKMVFLWLFMVFACVTIWKNKSQYSWKADDTLLVIWMLSGAVVALFAGIHGNEWAGAKGNAILILFFLVLKHVSLSEKLKKIIGLTILCSTLLAASEGLWQLYVTKQQSLLELNSVGHVNHSAIYLALNFAVALPMALVLKKSGSLKTKFFVTFCLLFTGACIVISNSRATILTMGIIAVSFGFVWLKRSKWPLVILSASILIASTGLYFANAAIVQKHLHYAAKESYLDARGPIWRSSLLVWRHFPLFGIGIRNYGQVDKDLQSEWLKEEGKNYIEGQYFTRTSHPHNFYLSVLAEQGMFGFIITLSVLGRIGFLLYKNRPKQTDSNSYWCVWLAAFGAMEVVLVNGLFNTTLHHEHGLFALLLIGIWWSSLDQRVQA